MGSVYRHQTRSNLRAEVSDLTKTLEMERGYNIEEWERSMPQEMRDELAARALIACDGDAIRAAARLGFKGWAGKKWASRHLPTDRIFNTPGCQAILRRDLASAEESRDLMIQRQIKIALYGEPVESTRAFQAIARVLGWQKTPDILVQNNRATTILALVTQKNHRGEIPMSEALEALAPGFLEHEPGAAVRIDSGITEALEE